MAELSFRAAIRADLPAVVAMLADDILGQARENPGETLDPAYVAAFEAIAANPNDRLVVAEQGGRVVGCLQLTFLPGLAQIGSWRGQIESVRVARGHRGAGIGREMLCWAIEQCRAKGCRMVQLTTNAKRADAARFYVSLGFEPSHVGMKLSL